MQRLPSVRPSVRPSVQWWLASVLLIATEATAQLPAKPSTWGTVFNHSISGPDATDPYAPFPSKVILTAGGITWDFEMPFNAVHMSLIPEGPDRG